MLWFSLVGVVAMAWLGWRPLARRMIRWKLGPYKVTVSKTDPALPRMVPTPKKVAVIGGGLAGIAAASTLGARGYAVTMLESKHYLGGKLGSWEVELKPGSKEWVSHGFHAFFRHYYNLNRFFDSLGLRKNFRAISDYRVLRQNGGEVSFGELESTPMLNLMALRNVGMYRYAEVTKAPTRHLMTIFLEYDPVTNARLDHMSFAEFARRAEVPEQLMIAFNTFSRAFFADEELMSMAEMLKSFHTFYLGHDGGLIYDFPTKDYEETLLKPIRAHLSSLKVDLRLSTPVNTLERIEDGYVVNGERFDKVVLATDVVGANHILGKAGGLEKLHAQFSKLKPGQRYSVTRLWLDKQARQELPVFVVTEKLKVLDSITFYDRTEDESAAWVKANGGSVVELHCYAVPEGMPEEEVKALFFEELKKFLPELQGATILHQNFRIARDFTAYHVGLAADRPAVETGFPGLYCAGDWVKLDFPAMLMEAAFASGMVAANRIFAEDGLQEELVESVPLKGMLAGIPESSARKKLLGLT
ncbi:MAG: phi-Carotenoid synthase [Myxococcaceae bacterium]|nr:phi-Carotenoid synthase [Myxococcaceae bacterium]